MSIRFAITNATTVAEAEQYYAVVDAELNALCGRRLEIIDQLYTTEHWHEAEEIAEHPDTMDYKTQFRKLMNEASFYSWARKQVCQ